jgi:hypothetical protein
MHLGGNQCKQVVRKILTALTIHRLCAKVNTQKRNRAVFQRIMLHEYSIQRFVPNGP